MFTDGIELEWAEVVAAYLVDNCKRYASGYCGGDTHFAIVPDDDKFAGFKKTSQPHMEELAAYLAGIGQALQVVLPNDSPRASPSAQTLKARAEFLIKAIERVQNDSYTLGHSESVRADD